MPNHREVQRAETAATGVGLLTLGLGAALIAAPAAVVQIQSLEVMDL